ncbi:hypothetical protein EOD10_29055 [Mesorhizobium sp. M7A.T.Ca.TU.009.01.3.2]|jgi:hypothetical protein|uniref:hypothetical protein n=1 Tax=unclassified Mesorhizobium TaxID=325217 RepID=UPI000FCC1C4C|nr:MULTISPECIES: hypothetical protein [unclassified Mesorhizobium]RUU08270.1 hypothetical protein EOD10_29055 [Mesorhizobium sp. M7A.T.Ca.TU.009.01.3.2]RUU89048.1 hypothetical protein EOD03_03755 [Mesorhizobium sp. M7A.T.Ca.TU.009.01.1.2]RUV08598.1 hypothetical protein EOD00_18325 [Mesorhizobium sp. M7A.T.Ca.TU.009.01.3.1]RUV53016.1 hypothetical protein EOB77_03860 [Mesorhizobium sp. M7A.F.Ca.MR.228.00.0.0]MCQ8873635.1 hypothetical protein [Mesorhizobium sp. LMG17149]
MVREQTGIDFGHEVTIGVTHLELLDDRRASVGVATYNFLFSIDTPKKATAPDKLNPIGHAPPVDNEDGKATVGGLVTAEFGPHQRMETCRAGALL